MNQIKYYKKAAMFGLDARIALAIFAALSVISGAALYKVLQHIQVVKAISVLDSMGKAYEQYILDTGVELEQNAASSIHFNLINFLQEPAGVEGWKGPYLSYSLTTDYSAELNKSIFNHPEYEYLIMSPVQGSSWGGATSTPACIANQNCYVYARLDTVDPALAKAIDIYIDGESDPANGRLRIYHRDATTDRVWLQVGRTLVQP
jgi:hypothetical protein